MLREMQVSGLTRDPANNAPIVMLREAQGTRVMPIWIGVIEASAIAFELEGVALSRPMTHDLLQTAITELGAAVAQVAIVELRDNTYYARIELTQQERTIALDARPSDAIALALRAKATILCEESVLERAQARVETPADGEAAAAASGANESEVPPTPELGPLPIIDPGSRSLLEVLEALSPEDFGKYKM